MGRLLLIALAPSPPQASQALTEAVNAAHSSGEKTSAGPAGFLLSRTATTPGRLRATSTEFPPL